MSQRKLVILFSIIALATQSCSLIRQAGTPGDTKEALDKPGQYDSACMKNNISEKDFTINRIKVRYSSQGENRNLSGFLKYKSNGELLLSLRSVAGIEVARILVADDSIKLYDKLNYILYLQDIDYLQKKFGIPYEALSLLWGDCPGFIGEKKREAAATEEAAGFRRGELDYLIEINSIYNKISRAELSNINGKRISLEMKDFSNDDNLVYPQKIFLKDINGTLSLDIVYSGINQERIKNMRFNTLNVKETKILK